MPSDPTDSNKLDVLELIISVLIEQEKALNELARRLSKAWGLYLKEGGV